MRTIDDEIGESGAAFHPGGSGGLVPEVRGRTEAEASLPFTMTTVATFELPWRLAFLPDGCMLIIEKVGPIWLVTQQGEKVLVGKRLPASINGR